MSEATLFDILEPREEQPETRTNQYRSPWTPDRDELLKQMWSEGMSYGLIAKAMPGFSRNAVIGRAHRLGLGGRTEAKPPRERAVPSLRRPPRRKSSIKGFHTSALTDLPPDYSEFAVGFYEAKADQCRYPIGDPKNLNDFKFCGGVVHGEHSYCARHCRIVYEPPRKPTGGNDVNWTQFQRAAEINRRKNRAA